MSAALVILPRVFAFADVSSLPHEAQPEVRVRKGPHALRLVRPEEYIRPVHRPATVLGVGYEFYRKYTEALLRRYITMSMESGRVPSMLGREMFRGNVSHCKVRSFEDVVNFVIDVERCLAQLSAGQQHLVRRIALEQYTQQEAAALLGMSLRTVVRRYAAALDRLTHLLLVRRLLEPLSAADLNSPDRDGVRAARKSVKGPAVLELPQVTVKMEVMG